ncbi:uncharacterized protein ACR2FA_009926 [Aphomia sociella]
MLHNNYYGWNNDRETPQNDSSDEEAMFFDKDTPAVVRDELNRIMVLRECLYEDPELIHEYIPWRKTQPHIEEEEPINVDTPSPETQETDSFYPSGYDWTKQQWQKAGNFKTTVNSMTCRTPQQSKTGQKSKFIRNMMTALSQPVKMSKAESMMQKMGWQGGALGKTGDGIVEPIVPDITYVTKTNVGFGQEEEKKQTKGKTKKTLNFNPVTNKIMKLKRSTFNMNVLLHILNFVKNYAEIEMVFDMRLSNVERKIIHRWVHEVINSDDGEASSEEWDVVKEIRESNNFLLGTESVGEKPFRKLIVYKEAPEYVYLITPEYLKDDDPVMDKQIAAFESNLNLKEKKDNFHVKTKNGTVAQENEPGHFKDEAARINATELAHNKLLNCLMEFANDDAYSELKFLGLYNVAELEAINEFWINVYKYMNWDAKTIDQRYLYVFPQTNLYFTMDLDSNGYNVIYKYLMDTPQ